ncbi:MAG: formylglycine-generating enzyme family protein [Polyangiaceae bacterium]
MRWVPGGTFHMGQDQRGELDERPEHDVTIDGFYLDLTEVSNAEYARCVEAKRCGPRDTESAARNKLGEDAQYRHPNQPVSAIRWDDAKAYCEFVGKRLPREAEWEHAARGDDHRLYPWGDEAPTPALAVFSTGPTAPVGTHPDGAGPYGHLDLAGNVWEWVEDFYDPIAYERPTRDRGVPGTCDEILATLTELRNKGKQGFTGSNPIPTECEHVLRGGAFNYPAAGLRVTNRVHHAGRMRLIMAGFRCAKDR